MRTGRQIEIARQKHSIPIFQMCNILAIGTELEYHKIISGRVQLTTYQKIMFVCATGIALDI
ncbi:MAG: hypothetical protein IJX43_03145 [Alphaproteobacteria bacterium]|nr:hypothetical protein [Alphaproteobacteria bacterium]